jgi:hypothetical protein
MFSRFFPSKTQVPETIRTSLENGLSFTNDDEEENSEGCH